MFSVSLSGQHVGVLVMTSYCVRESTYNSVHSPLLYL